MKIAGRAPDAYKVFDRERFRTFQLRIDKDGMDGAAKLTGAWKNKSRDQYTHDFEAEQDEETAEGTSDKCNPPMSRVANSTRLRMRRLRGQCHDRAPRVDGIEGHRNADARSRRLWALAPAQCNTCLITHDLAPPERTVMYDVSHAILHRSRAFGRCFLNLFNLLKSKEMYTWSIRPQKQYSCSFPRPLCSLFHWTLFFVWAFSKSEAQACLKKEVARCDGNVQTNKVTAHRPFELQRSSAVKY